ncbi:hypothetical protein HYZ99_04165 [Candidatus Peregrinibacteria bacterium]|nr:hypothetical protein [Candidatus Peregrinibacteria bacterium]
MKRLFPAPVGSARPGSMLLVTVLIVGSIALLTSISVALRGMHELSMAQGIRKSMELTAIADGCMEEAMLRLSRSSSYAGGTLAVGGGSCTIVVSGTGSLRTIAVDAAIGRWAKELTTQATLEAGAPDILFWTEGID